MPYLHATRKKVNAADVEHVGAMVLGSLLLLAGSTNRGVKRHLLSMAGAGLMYRGTQGYRRLYELLGLRMADQPSGVGRQNIRIESSVVVDRPCSEVYRIWRHLENLPVFMDHLIEVKELDDVRSHWVARAPAGMVIEWDAEIVNDVENQIIAFRTVEGSGVDMAGSTHFDRLAKDRTKVRTVLRYDPPADMVGVWIAKVFRSDPQRQIDADLIRFKRILEVGNRSLPARPLVEMI